MLARDVLAHHHWLLPNLPDGRPHLAKPPLVAWLISLASWPAGAVSAQTAILPSLVEAVGLVLVMYLIGRRLFGAEVGVMAALIAVTTVGVFSFAHSAMPDMALLLATTGAMAAYLRFESDGSACSLLGFYALIGIACLTKGAAGLLPLVIVLAYTLICRSVAQLRALVSASGFALLLLIAVPWWVVAVVAGRKEFIDEIVFQDQLLWYFRTTGWSWRMIPDAINGAIAVTLPWCLLLPFAIRSAIRQADAKKVRHLRLLLVWLVTVFAIMAVSGQQRERYYLPLCPALALLVGWWYSTLVWRRRALAFAGVWVAVVMVGGIVDTIHTRHLNVATNLEALRAAVTDHSGVLYSTDVPELALTFHLDRPVVGSKPVVGSQRYHEIQERAKRDGRLLISDRAQRSLEDRSCMRQVGVGTLDRHPIVLLSTVECGQPQP